MCRILYRLLVSLAGLAVRSGRSKDYEIIVLRHQLTVLHRQNNRPALADEDRALLAGIAARHGLVSGGREPPPPALSEPYVTVSRHTAPTVRRSSASVDLSAPPPRG